MQDLRNQREEITDAATGQRRADCRTAFSFAKLVIIDVRMGDPIVASRGIRLQRHDLVSARSIEMLPAKPDLEPSQTQIIKHDGRGCDA